jgi:hypothetical protein
MAMKLTPEQIARIQSLENELGQLTPDAVLADAKSKASPLHTLFEWDKAKAAQAYWLDCAREVIRTVKMVVTTEQVTCRTVVYVRDPDAGPDQGYRRVDALKSDPVSARQVLIDELTRAAGNIMRARNLAIALGLVSEVDDLLERIVGLRVRVDTTRAA